MRNIYTPRTPLSIFTIFCFLFVANLSFGQHAPVAFDDYLTVEYSASFDTSINIMENDFDSDNDIDLASYKIISQSSYSYLIDTFNGAPFFYYIPKAGFLGKDTITYKMCDKTGLCDTGRILVTIIPVSYKPENMQQNFDNYYAIPSLNVGFNDFDYSRYFLIRYPELSINFNLLKQPKWGKVTMSATSFQYNVANINFVGSDTLFFQGCTSQGVCANFSYVITIVNTNMAPRAYDDYFTSGGKGISNNVGSDDYDSENNISTFKLIKNPKLGTIKLALDGSFSYTPFTGKLGLDTMNYQVCDLFGLCDTGTLEIEIVQNSPPVARNDNFQTTGRIIHDFVSSNDRDPDGNSMFFKLLTNPKLGTVSINVQGEFVYEPYQSANGIDSMLYEVCDNYGECSTAFLIIKVNTPIVLPVAQNDYFTTSVNDTIAGSVSWND